MKKNQKEDSKSSVSFDPKRVQALDRALIASRLLDNRYFPIVSEALQKGEKGKTAFEKVCVTAGISPDMATALWETLMFIEKDKIRCAAVDW